MEKITHTKYLSEDKRIAIIEDSSRLIGRAIFFSMIVTIISFTPILFLTGQEKKLFSPLVLTKTFTMIGAVIISILILPMLIRTMMRGKLVPESRNPISTFFVRVYSPVIHWCLNWRKTTIAISIILFLASIPMILTTGREFMPPLDEGSILFMPVTLPDASNTEIKRILQIQDQLLKSLPEVENVLGKAGRAYTATDNAPLSMIESIILLKPQSHWRKGMTKDKLIAEMDKKLQIPGVTNGWTQPIINRINMLSTGIRTDVGIKIYGNNIDTIFSIGREVEKALKGVEGLADLYAEQLTGGKYIDIQIKRQELGRYGLSVEDVNTVIESALGGMTITNTVEGRERYSINLRLAQDFRKDFDIIMRTPLQSANFGSVPLSAVAELKITEGPPMINSENAMLRGTVLFNIRGRDMSSVVNDAKERVAKHFRSLPKGYFLDWSGQYENQLRAEQRLKIIIPIVLAIICVILYFTFHSVKEALIVLSSIPIALIGGIYSIHFFDVNFSVAVAVGFIALFGIAVETGVLMIVYMNDSLGRLTAKRGNSEEKISRENIVDAVYEGAVLRLRPKLMTVLANMVGMIPVLAATGTGSDVMKPITIPFVFGLISSTLFVLIVLPVIYAMVKEHELHKTGHLEILDIED